MSTITTTDTLTGHYTLDPSHSRLGFAARHAMVTKVRGAFNDVEGSGYFDAADPTRSYLELTIKAASIDTRNADRDAHLRSNDFFDMENYPEIRFVSTSVEPLDDNTFRITGDLSIKGVVKPVTVDVDYTGSAVDPFGNSRVGLEGSVTVNRKDWGLNWNAALDAGGVLVSEEVTLELEVSAIRTATYAAHVGLDVADVQWLEKSEEEAWRRLQLMQLQLAATLGRQLAEDSGLSYPDYMVLAVLTDRPGGRMRAYELGRTLGWEKSRLSHHVSRMVRRGLVTKKQCETDQRGAFVVVTSRGRKRIQTAAPGHVAAVRRHFIDLLTPAQLETLSTIAETVLDGLTQECAEAPE